MVNLRIYHENLIKEKLQIANPLKSGDAKP
jgi:hypothetical protein